MRKRKTGEEFKCRYSLFWWKMQVVPFVMARSGRVQVASRPPSRYNTTAHQAENWLKPYIPHDRRETYDAIFFALVGVLQFEVIMARLKTEYGVDAVYEAIDFAIARWVSCADPKQLEAFEKANPSNLAMDSEGNLTYLDASEWRLQYVAKQWPEIIFMRTRERHRRPSFRSRRRPGSASHRLPTRVLVHSAYVSIAARPISQFIPKSPKCTRSLYQARSSNCLIFS